MTSEPVPELHSRLGIAALVLTCAAAAISVYAAVEYMVIIRGEPNDFGFGFEQLIILFLLSLTWLMPLILALVSKRTSNRNHHFGKLVLRISGGALGVLAVLWIWFAAPW